MLKRVFSMLLVMVMLFTMLPVNVFAVTTEEENTAAPEITITTADPVTTDTPAAPTDDASASEPVSSESEEAPAEEGSEMEAPVNEETPAEESDGEEMTSEEAPAEEAAEEISTEEAPAEEFPGEEIAPVDAAEETVEEAAEEAELTAEASEVSEELLADDEAAQIAEEEPASYDVTITVSYAGNGGGPDGQQTHNASGVQVTVTRQLEDGSEETAASGTTSRNGNVTLNLTEGTYTASTSWTSGNYTYSGSQTFTVPDTTSVSITAEGTYSYTSAENTYNNTTYFNHVDIRVNGNFTYNGTTYNITLKNPTVTIVDGGTIKTKSFTNSTTYEWRWEELSVSKSAVITVVFDIYLDGKLAYEDYSVTYSGKDAFVYAIQICDGHEGLDFRVSEARIIEAILYQVSYQWDGEYPSTASLPGTTGGYESGDTHTIDTTYVEGDQITDTANGYVYTFQGWDNWSDEDTEKTAVTGSSLEITSDTIIYGHWVKEPLPLAEGYITLSKTFDGEHPAAAEGLYFEVTAPDGTSTTVPYAQASAGCQIPVTQEGTWTITEKNADADGYTRTTTVNAVAGDSASITVDLPYAVEAEVIPVNVGSAAFVNSYEKNVGEPVHNLPSLSITKVDGETDTALAGAVFTLSGTDYSVTAASDANGVVTFAEIPAGTYTLTETTAPAGYMGSAAEYSVVVAQTGSEEALVDGVFVTTYFYAVTVDGQETITVANEKIKGSLNITKSFDIAPTAGTEIKLTVTGPEGYSNTITLNGSENWTAALTDLLPGTYTVSEISSITPGYDWTGAEFAVTGSAANGTASGNAYTFDILAGATTAATVANLSVTNSYEPWDKAGFQILKVDAEDSSVKLAGVSFGLYSGSELIASATTKADGIASFTGLDAEGSYTLKEIATLNDYVLSDKAWTVEVTHAVGEDGKTDYVVKILDGYTVVDGVTLTVTNKQKVGQLTVAKAFGEANELPENDRIAISVTVTGPNGYSKALELSKDNGWTATLTGLKLGQYTVTEDLANAAVPGYELTTEYSVEGGVIDVTAENETVPAVVTVTNTYDKKEETVNNAVEFIIAKKGIDGIALPGAEFTLYDDAGSIVTTALTGADGRASFTISVDPDEVTDATTYTKSFTLKETKAPEGYVPSDDTWTITVALENGEIIVRVNEAKNVFESIFNWIISQVKPGNDYSYTSNVLTIYNDPTELTITKTEKWYLDGKEVTYADVSGYKAQDRIYTFNVLWTLGEKSGSETAVINLGDADKTNDVAVIKGIPVGAVYTVIESEGDYVTEYVGNGGTMADASAVTVVNSYYYVLDTGLNLNLKKIDADERFAMPGITFDLIDAEGDVIASDVSDANGLLSFEITEAGTYHIIEKAAPSGYEKLDPILLKVVQKVETVDNVTGIYLEVDVLDLEVSGGVYLIENQPEYVDVSVTKKWDYVAGEITLPGSVEMVLYRNGQKYATVTLSEENNWTHTWKDLPAYDEWEVDEVNVPEGFNRVRSHSGNDWVITNCASSNPKTGDVIMIAVIVMLLALAAVVVLIIAGKKKKK